MRVCGCVVGVTVLEIRMLVYFGEIYKKCPKNGGLCPILPKKCKKWRNSAGLRAILCAWGAEILVFAVGDC